MNAYHPVEDWKRLYREGKSMRDIANKYHVSERTVAKAFVRAGVALRAPRGSDAHKFTGKRMQEGRSR